MGDVLPFSLRSRPVDFARPVPMECRFDGDSFEFVDFTPEDHWLEWEVEACGQDEIIRRAVAFGPDLSHLCDSYEIAMRMGLSPGQYFVITFSNYRVSAGSFEYPNDVDTDFDSEFTSAEPRSIAEHLAAWEEDLAARGMADCLIEVSRG